jgi:hypothetical protein
VVVRQSDAITAIRFILTSYNLRRELRSFAVLFFGDLLHPLHGYAIELFLYRNVRHCCVWRSTVPVLHSLWNPDNIPLSNLLNRASPLLNPARPIRHNQDLTERVRVPSAPRTRLERDLSSACA